MCVGLKYMDLICVGLMRVGVKHVCLARAGKRVYLTHVGKTHEGLRRVGLRRVGFQGCR